MDYQDYVKEELIILIPVLYLLGIGLKKSTMPDKWIPLMLGIIAIVLSAMWVIATGDISSFKETVLSLFISITQGILVAGASVYANQIYIQVNKED